MRYREVQGVLFLVGAGLITCILLIENFFLHNLPVVLGLFSVILLVNRSCEWFIERKRKQENRYN